MLQSLRKGGKRIKTIWWIITVATVGSFVLGFIFLPGAMKELSLTGGSGSIGTVNGKAIPREDYINALAEQRASYSRQYGMEPADRDLKMLEVQAWRSMVVQRLMAEKAQSLGIKAHDREIVVSLENQPPMVLRTNPAFLTNGQFDPAKYQAELKNPNNNWAGFEESVRQQLPMRKYQERLLSSIKVTEPELQQAYKDRFERLTATLVQVAPSAPPATAAKASDAELKRLYDKYKVRFAHAARTQLEMLIVPKQFGPEETKTARDLAQSLVRRARSGEDFAALARDYSEGPGAENGGVLNRLLGIQDFGQAIGPQIAALDTGGVTDPYQDAGRFLIFKVLGKQPDPQTGQPSFRVAQIVVKVRADDEQMKTQLAELQKLRSQAVKQGLGKAAAAKGLATSTSPYFEISNPPQELFSAPDAADWGLGAKAGAVSPVFEGIDEWVLVQVAKQEPAGIPPLETVKTELEQLAQIDAAVEKSKPVADAIAKGVASGQTLDQAAAAAGVQTAKVDMTRAQPDPRLSAVPELIGQLFASPGKVIGPVRGVNGWYFGRADLVAPADPAMYDQVKGQFSSELLQRRQQTFYNNYLAILRGRAKITDARTATDQQSQ